MSQFLFIASLATEFSLATFADPLQHQGKPAPDNSHIAKQIPESPRKKRKGGQERQPSDDSDGGGFDWSPGAIAEADALGLFDP